MQIICFLYFLRFWLYFVAVHCKNKKKNFVVKIQRKGNSLCTWEFGVVIVKFGLTCDHALSLYLCNLFSGGGHATFLLQITCKKARIWTFFWLDRKQYVWFAPFRLAKMPLSVSCCWFQSAFLLAYKWAVNTHASSLSNFCRLSFLEFEESLNRNFIHWNVFHLIV